MEKKAKLCTLLIFTVLVATACGENASDSEAKELVANGMQEIENSNSVDSTELVDSAENTEIVKPIDDGSYDFIICFAGDVSIADGAITTGNLDASENGIYDCISEELVDIMHEADVMCRNNEFTYSTNGSPMADIAGYI